MEGGSHETLCLSSQVGLGGGGGEGEEERRGGRGEEGREGREGREEKRGGGEGEKKVIQHCIKYSFPLFPW